MKLGWYVDRLRRMSVAEVTGRVQVAARQKYWASPARRPDGLQDLKPGRRTATVALSRRDAPAGTAGAEAAVAAADRLLAGTWPVFCLPDVPVGAAPDWFRDPLSGRAAPQHGYAFDVPYRDETRVGNIKFVWDLSRHQATTLLASAWWLTGNDAYAVRAAEHLTAWWRDNPFLTGVHWTSAIEVGLRLLSWTWMRALLAEWPGVDALFDSNDVFAAQLYYHQLYIEKFHSVGSSANNHLIAELAGLSAAATAFPWFARSAGWSNWARDGLVEQAATQTHPDGFNREQASEYHLFVMEMLFAAALAARLASRPFLTALDDRLRQMADALAASLDAAGQPPRFGDGDDGRGLLLDAPDFDHTAVVLDAARALYGACPWWPAPGGSVLGNVAALTEPFAAPRDLARPSEFPGAGMTILRAGSGGQEVWVRCDAGPHGFLSIAAHGHADALSIELRVGGVEVLADPGTYCYHGQKVWRDYFKGTIGHNTLTVDGVDQASGGGPFLWLSHPVTQRSGAPDGPLSWQASHDGYRRLPDPVSHHRRVVLHPDGRQLDIADWIESAVPHDVALHYHFGPAVAVVLAGAVARLTWPGGNAEMTLPPHLAWSSHCGEQDPPLGWYSAGFGHKVPAGVLAGRGALPPGVTLATRLAFGSTASHRAASDKD